MSSRLEAAAAATAAAHLIEHGGWVSGQPAADKDGASVEPADPKAVAWSFMGAVDKVTSDVEVRRLLIREGHRRLQEFPCKWEHRSGKEPVVALLREIAKGLRGE